MPHFLLTWLVTAVSLMITANFVNGFKVDDFVSALVAVVILGLVNAIVRPLLVVLTLPITFLTLGLFLFIINAITIWVAGAIAPGFDVTNLGAALIGSIVLTVVASLLNFVVDRVIR